MGTLCRRQTVRSSDWLELWTVAYFVWTHRRPVPSRRECSTRWSIKHLTRVDEHRIDFLDLSGNELLEKYESPLLDRILRSLGSHGRDTYALGCELPQRLAVVCLHRNRD
ncbi:hypothetical protein A6U98_01540 [Rhizobium sp. WYCCWR10014]|nr:hypothetical protein A6U98_01540 [Rhizobium sp. WYCCWR10014]